MQREGDPVAPAGVSGTAGMWIGPRQGTVTEFDEVRGLGTVSDGHGRQYGFHCTAMADGTRQIAVGAAVVFVVAPGHHGQLEAQGIRQLGT